MGREGDNANLPEFVLKGNSKRDDDYKCKMFPFIFRLHVHQQHL